MSCRWRTAASPTAPAVFSWDSVIVYEEEEAATWTARLREAILRRRSG